MDITFVAVIINHKNNCLIMASNHAPKHRMSESLTKFKRVENPIHKKKVSDVYETTNYDWFDISDAENRDLDENNIKRLLKSFNRKQIKIPISVVLKPGKEHDTKGCYLTRDGQHRVYVCKLLGVPVVYNIVKDFDSDDVAHVNSANKKWDGKDYLGKFVAEGNPNYINFKKLVDPHSDWEMKIFFDILNERSEVKSLTNQSFKRGELEFSDADYEKARRTVWSLVKFDKFSKSGHTRRYLFGAIITLLSFEEFDDKRLETKIASNTHKLQFYDRLTAFNSVVEIYNKGLSPAGGRIMPTIVGNKILGITIEARK